MCRIWIRNSKDSKPEYIILDAQHWLYLHFATTRKGRMRRMKTGVKRTPRQMSRTRPTSATTTATGSNSMLRTG